MKKTYINPTMAVVKVKTRSLLQEASNPKVSISRNSSVEAGSIDSRRDFSIWDEDEEE